MMFEGLCEMEGIFFIFVQNVEFAAPVDQKFAHLQLPLPGSVEEAGLVVHVQMVDLDPVAQ